MSRSPRSRPGLCPALALLFVLLLPSCVHEPVPVVDNPTPSGGGGGGAVAEVQQPTVVRPSAAGAPAHTPTSTPTAAASPTLVPSPTRGPTAHTVQPGDTLTAIAARYGVSIADLMAANGISNPNMIYVGQLLHLPHSLEAAEGPLTPLLPDSEVIYSPAYRDFDTQAEILRFGGFLASYREVAENEVLTGPEIVERVAKRFSVGPRVLLALLELQSGWVTHSEPAERTFPLGQRDGSRSGLFLQLSWAANRLNEGYYGQLLGRQNVMRFRNGERLRFASGLNPGSAAVQHVLALVNTSEDWQHVVVGDGFAAVYGRLFGDPWAREIEVVPPDLTQPPLRLPWSDDEIWYYTGGPHGGWGEGSARAALDFVPAVNTGCGAAAQWAVAVADGLIVRSENGEVVLDLDGDGFIGTGWTILYMHMASHGRVPVGTRVRAGDPIGHPSCEGGFADATHLHLARRYNGQWLQADAPPAFVLAGWQAVAWEQSYDGELVRGDQRRTACACRRDDLNAITSQ